MSRYLGINFQDAFGSLSSGSWILSTVDSIGDVGRYTSIAIDSNGKAHISYYDYTNLDLKYATNASGSWVLVTIDGVDNVGASTSIAIDSNNKVHISYYDTTNYDLKYATNASGSWVLVTIDSTDDVGEYASIAIDYNDKIHISYYDNTNAVLKYTTNASGSWVISVLGSADTALKDSISIAIDSNNKVHISYCYSTNYNLKYVTNVSGSWIFSTIDSVGTNYTSIAIDSNDKVHISYYDTVNYDLKYATNVSGSWVLTIVDNAASVGAYTSIAIDSNNKIHISYYDPPNLNLKYATNASGSWALAIIDSIDDVGAYTSIAIDSSDNPHISYYDITNLDLKYAVKASGYLITQLQIISETLSVQKDMIVAESRKPRFEEPMTYEGYNTVTGGFNTECHPIEIGYILKGWTGAFSSTAVSSIYKHVFVPETTDFSTKAAVYPLAIDVYRDVGSVFSYYDMLIDNFTLDFAYGALVKSSVSLMGGKYTTNQKVSPTYIGGNLFTWDTCSVTLDGMATTAMTNLSFTFNNNLANKGTLDGTKTPNRTKRNGFRTVEISGVMLFDAMTQYEKYDALTRQQMILYCAGDAIGNGENSIKIDIPQMLYLSFSTPMMAKGILQSSFSAKAEFDETSNYLVQVTLTNTKSGY